jgi:hypothetical protein
MNTNFQLNTSTENIFSIEELQSGFLYEVHKSKNEKVIHSETENSYFALSFPKIKGETVSLIHYCLQMPVTKQDDEILFFENKGNYYTVTKKGVNIFKVTIIFEQARQRPHSEIGIINFGEISLNYNFHTFKEIYHIFNYTPVTREEIEEAICNKFIIKP